MAAIDRQREEQLVQDNLGLVVTLAKFFKPPNATEMDEYVQVGTIALWRAIRKHDPARGALSTIAWIYIKRDLILYINKQKKHWNVRGSDAVKYNAVAPHFPQLWEILPDTLTADEKTATELRAKGYKFKDIAQVLGGSRQRSHEIFKSAIRKINESNNDNTT